MATSLEDATWKNTTEFVPLVTEGKVIKVYDCDTITIATKFPYLSTLNESNTIYRFHVRLLGIDTPEMKTKNEDEKKIAHMAQKTLSELILNKNVSLKNTSLDKYGRILANVYMENGVELSKWAIENRFAVSYDGGTKKPPKSWTEYYNTGTLTA
jgi:endonuclease YncB( thermonuclease family)